MKTQGAMMKCVMVGCFLYLHWIIGAQSLLETSYKDKDNSSSLIQPSVLHDMLKRESQVRLTMVKHIQDLVMVTADNKKTNQALMRNLSDITTMLQVITEKDRLIEEENVQLKLELDILKDAIKNNEKIQQKNIHNLDMTTIPLLVAKWERDYSEFKHQLKTMIETDRNMEEARNRLDDEIMKLKLNRNLTVEALQRLTDTGLSLARKQLSALQEANEELSSDNTEMEKQLAILNGSLRNTVNKEQIAVFRFDYNQRFQMFNQTLNNYSLSINETLESFLAEKRNECDEQTSGVKGSCMEILKVDPQTQGKDGVYQIRVDSEVKSVYCDMSTKGGGWTAIQRRQDGSTDFNRTWSEYKQGFGDPSTNYWIGNDAIHALAEEKQTLRVQLQGFDGTSAYADYSSFFFGNEAEKYRLLLSGYSGTAGDALIYHNAMNFSTPDQDNDYANRHCAKIWGEGWWFNSCFNANLNADYADSAVNDPKYMTWYPWKAHVALKGSLMMIRPKS
ncbi:fibroleukin-like [Ostrea edulis]|uniref:fibroleukin-like n=1 Tax=Ostrea edulis TaxID=37623 RepID=UPI0024AEE0E9|nr:fibroleukin-like [Ostrea edulis]